jgi:3'-phosphoadenosine 5'-phosphosulfate sulfotransferase (PAPS reductase)/FAD synthetase
MHHRQANLRRLEAEAIFTMREVVAEFQNPVILYSIGKDSSVMLHVAQKAFYPSKPPFPLLHVDTTWKFSEMITFRDATAARLGMDLIVHINQEGLARFLIAPLLTLGIREISAPNCGAYSTHGSSQANRCAFSHFPIGLNSMFGTT